MNDIIKVGAQAPDFKLKDQSGKEVTLSEFKGKKVLLSWHPLAWTSVCTDQMRALDRDYDRFSEKNTVVLGFSVDPQPSKSAWAKALCLSKLPILADFHPIGAVAKAYGIFSEDYGASKRANILISEDGKVIWTKKYDIPQLPDIEEVLAQLS
ncbi:peroxiredoxin [Bacillota bacterium]